MSIFKKADKVFADIQKELDERQAARRAGDKDEVAKQRARREQRRQGGDSR